MSTTKVMPGPESETSEFMRAEAKRLMDFKREHVKNDETPCPKCATFVSIRAVKCPQCTSDISQHTKNVREELNKLKEVTGQLHDLHRQEMELIKHEASDKPIWERIQSFFSDPKFVQDMKLVLPFIIGLFGILIYASGKLSGFIFLLTLLVGGFVISFLFKKWGLTKYITLDLYRGFIIAGLFVILGSATFETSTFWPEMSFLTQTVEIRSESANIRQSPTTNSSVVTTAVKGDKLVILEKRSSWYKVKTSSGTVGWVHSSLLNNP
ncbi:MAG: SH3 domain-containing protein [candidate division Zixibacteria bacterium]|nr:SH3 domain-containing protein [candidate division Zixibacteria bacterium]